MLHSVFHTKNLAHEITQANLNKVWVDFSEVYWRKFSTCCIKSYVKCEMKLPLKILRITDMWRERYIYINIFSLHTRIFSEHTKSFIECAEEAMFHDSIKFGILNSNPHSEFFITLTF